MSTKQKIMSFLMAITLLAITGCGDEWSKIAKLGNSWDYNVTKNGKTVKVTSKVTAKYKIGKVEYAEITPSSKLDKLNKIIYSWNKDKKALLLAGRSSRLNDKNIHFRLNMLVVGALKPAKDAKYKESSDKTVAYIGEEKVKVPAGKYKTYKFVRTDNKRNKKETYWYAAGVGFVKIVQNKVLFELVKFNKGKGGDAKKIADYKSYNVVKKFYADAFAGKGVSELVKSYFGSAKLKDKKMKELNLLIKRIKGKSKPANTTLYCPGLNRIGLRFKYYDDLTGMPNVYVADVVFHVDNKAKLVDFITSFSPLMK